MIADLKKLIAIPLEIDISFFLLLFFLPISNYFIGGTILGLSTLAVLPTVFLFALLHEYGHCWAAHRCGIGVISIKLWCLGGLATLEDTFEIAPPMNEIFIAFAGPLVNLIISLIAGIAALIFGANIFLAYIIAVNQVLAIFNLIPAFPMDGGRILRGLLHYFLDDREKATLISAKIGVLMSIGFLSVGFYSGNILLMMIFGWVGMICYSILQDKSTIA